MKLISTAEDTFKGFAKLEIENGVNDWINERVDVT